MDQGGAEQAFAHDRHPPRGGSPGVLLVEDDLLGHRRAPSSVLDRPAQAGPSGVGQDLFPTAADLESERLVARTASALELGELSDDVLVQEPPHLGAERHVLRAVAQIHRPGSVAKLAPLI